MSLIISSVSLYDDSADTETVPPKHKTTINKMIKTVINLFNFYITSSTKIYDVPLITGISSIPMAAPSMLGG